MPTTAQPAAGTALHSDWTTGLVFARNEAETTATTLAAGTANRVDGTVTMATDADGRYKTFNSSVERWDGLTFGPTMTMMVIVKRVSSGGNQALIDADQNPPRNWQWRINSDGTVQWIGFDTGESVDTNFATTATVDTADDVAVIVRIRNDAGTYKVKLWVGSTATAEVAYAGTPAAIGSTERIGLTDRLGGSQPSASKNYFGAIWSSALSDTDCATLGSNGWAVYDAKPVGGPVLSAPTASATGTSGQVQIGVSIDAVAGVTLKSLQRLAASPAADAATVLASGVARTLGGSAGAQGPYLVTGLTDGTAYAWDWAATNGSNSNVVTSTATPFTAGGGVKAPAALLARLLTPRS